MGIFDQLPYNLNSTFCRGPEQSIKFVPVSHLNQYVPIADTTAGLMINITTISQDPIYMNWPVVGGPEGTSYSMHPIQFALSTSFDVIAPGFAYSGKSYFLMDSIRDKNCYLPDNTAMKNNTWYKSEYGGAWMV